MKNKFMLLAIFVLIAGLLSACASGPLAPANAQVQTTSAKDQTVRMISVTGTGRVYLTPDLAYINIGVHTEASDVKEALASNTSQAQQVATVLTALGVDPKDIQTTSFNVSPVQQNGPNGEITGIKYTVDNTVYVTVRNLTKLGDLLDGVVRSGANNINSVSFDVSNKDQALSQARQAAVAAARSQATELAQAAGVQLGDLQNLNVYTNGVPVPMFDAKGGAGVGSSAVPVSAGQLVIQVDANLSYGIK